MSRQQVFVYAIVISLLQLASILTAALFFGWRGAVVVGLITLAYGTLSLAVDERIIDSLYK